jgi:hypothetical protein
MSTTVIEAAAGDGIEAAIRREHEAASTAARSALDHALECGRLLAQAREGIAHGGWESFVRDRCGIAPRTARLYLRLDANRGRLANRQHVAGLTVRQAAMELAEPRVKAEPEAAVPDWYAPLHFHYGNHPDSGWSFYVWPHPMGEPWVHMVTLMPLDRGGTPVAELLKDSRMRDLVSFLAAGPKRGVRIDAVSIVMSLQAANGMPDLGDAKWHFASYPWSAERIANEPDYNRWLFWGDENYRERGMGIEPRRKARQEVPA